MTTTLYLSMKPENLDDMALKIQVITVHEMAGK